MELGRVIDHIVYVTPKLEQYAEYLSKKLGVDLVIGGRHLNKGTRNALLNLGNGCYLELLSVDEANKNIQPPRWMGVDLIEKPTISRWSLKSTDLESDCKILKEFDQHHGIIERGERKTQSGELLSWSMALPLSEPDVDIMPFFTDWQHSSFHPTEKLEEGCILQSLVVYHPQAEMVQSYMDRFGLNIKVEQWPSQKISISIKSPNGTFHFR